MNDDYRRELLHSRRTLTLFYLCALGLHVALCGFIGWTVFDALRLCHEGNLAGGVMFVATIAMYAIARRELHGFLKFRQEHIETIANIDRELQELGR